MIVKRRWATASRVTLRNASECSVRWMAASVAKSIIAVASSKTNTRVCRKRARPMQSSCLSPTLKFPPPSTTVAPKPLEYDCTVSSMPQACSAFQISPSWYSSKGSILKRKLPLKSIGSCGTTAMARRILSRPSVAMSTESSKIRPADGSSNRKTHKINDDFPLPVLPTTPHFSPPESCAVTFSSTRSSSGRYRTLKPSNESEPVTGQSVGSLLSTSSFSGAASCGSPCIHSVNRWNAFIFASVITLYLTANRNSSVKIRQFAKARPANFGSTIADAPSDDETTNVSPSADVRDADRDVRRCSSHWSRASFV
mmetsp:Transcript_154408/g.296443  ORF Transcript_154408/g.296443 Transcript_154408/m.296443 type:complete len:312 (+) Transcript_154408:366-1301(+)